MVKFGKDLAANKNDKWKDHYLKYHDMKKVLDAAPGDGVKAEFDALYEESLRLVNSFHQSKIEEYDRALSAFEDLQNDRSSDLIKEERRFFRTFKEVGEFQTYVWLNATGFRKIMKKYDKRMMLRGTGHERQAELENELLLQPFMNSQLETLLARAKSVGHTSGSTIGGTGRDMKLIGGSGNRELAEEISGRLGIPLLKADIKKFNDGEVSTFDGMMLRVNQCSAPSSSMTMCEGQMCISFNQHVSQ